MATKEELFAAVRLIKEHCGDHDAKYCRKCQLYPCAEYFICAPCDWPDPEEGGDN